MNQHGWFVLAEYGRLIFAAKLCYNKIGSIKLCVTHNLTEPILRIANI